MMHRAYYDAAGNLFYRGKLFIEAKLVEEVGEE